MCCTSWARCLVQVPTHLRIPTHADGASNTSDTQPIKCDNDGCCIQASRTATASNTQCRKHLLYSVITYIITLCIALLSCGGWAITKSVLMPMLPATADYADTIDANDRLALIPTFLHADHTGPCRWFLDDGVTPSAGSEQDSLTSCDACRVVCNSSPFCKKFSFNGSAAAYATDASSCTPGGSGRCWGRAGVAG